MCLLLLVAFFSLSASAQDSYFDNLDEDAVTLRFDARLIGMLETAAKINSYTDEVPGYRIQITSNKDKNFIFKEKTKLYQAFPKMDIYVVYEQPYYKLRVGDYVTRLEATKGLMDMVEEYQYAFIVNDMIEPK
jgi:predicted phosphohydrolase